MLGSSDRSRIMLGSSDMSRITLGSNVRIIALSFQLEVIVHPGCIEWIRRGTFRGLRVQIQGKAIIFEVAIISRSVVSATIVVGSVSVVVASL